MKNEGKTFRIPMSSLGGCAFNYWKSPTHSLVIQSPTLLQWTTALTIVIG